MTNMTNTTEEHKNLQKEQERLRATWEKAFRRMNKLYNVVAQSRSSQESQGRSEYSEIEKDGTNRKTTATQPNKEARNERPSTGKEQQENIEMKEAAVTGRCAVKQGSRRGVRERLKETTKIVTTTKRAHTVEIGAVMYDVMNANWMIRNQAEEIPGLGTTQAGTAMTMSTSVRTKSTADIGQNVNFADVVREVRTESSKMRNSLTGRIDRVRRILQQLSVCIDTSPKIKALYFENCRTGPVWPVR